MNEYNDIRERSLSGMGRISIRKRKTTLAVISKDIKIYSMAGIQSNRNSRCLNFNRGPYYTPLHLMSDLYSNIWSTVKPLSYYGMNDDYIPTIRHISYKY